jgi:hypothetical protein
LRICTGGAYTGGAQRDGRSSGIAVIDKDFGSELCWRPMWEPSSS